MTDNILFFFQESIATLDFTLKCEFFLVALLDDLPLLGEDVLVFLELIGQFLIVILYLLVFIKDLQEIIVLILQLSCQFLKVFLGFFKVELHLVFFPLECGFFTFKDLKSLLKLYQLGSQLYFLRLNGPTGGKPPEFLSGAFSSESLIRHVGINSACVGMI